MTTGVTNWIIATKKTVSTTDLGTRFQTPLRQADRDRFSKIYPDDGVFGDTKLGLTGTPDNLTITGTAESTDGVGEVLDHTLATDDGSLVPFENTVAIPYYVALRAIEHPQGIQINARTGAPEYQETLEDIGEKGDPDSVVDNGADLTLNINSLLESGVDHSGRTALVYKKIPAAGATTEAVAIETVTVAYAAPNNTVTTTGLLGQSSPASILAADYEVVVLGPTVRRNTDLRTVSGIVFIGIVTGGGPATIPSAFDVTDQNLINVTLSGFNATLDAFIQNKTVDPTLVAGPRAVLLGGRGAHAGVLYPGNGLIYLMGGLDSVSAELDDNDSYDAVNDSWTARTVIPVQSGSGPAVGARNSAVSAVFGDTIYLFGGVVGLTTWYELVQRYKPVTNTWDTVGADMPVATSAGAVGVINSKIYYAGGRTASGTNTDDTHEYDPVLDSWTTVASISTAIATLADSFAYSVVDDKLYLFGGVERAGGTLLDRVLSYDPALDQWVNVTTLPNPSDPSVDGDMAQAQAETVNDVIHIFGGNLDPTPQVTNYHLLFNASDNTFMSLGRLENGAPRCALGTLVADSRGVLYLMGGGYGVGGGDVEDFNSGFDARNIHRATNHGIASTTGDHTPRTQTSTWDTTHANGDTYDTMETARFALGAVEFEGAIYVCGGTDGTTTYDTAEVFHPETNTWTVLSDMANTRSHHGFLVHRERRKLYAVMGTPDGGTTSEDTIEEYDVDADVWATTESGIASPTHSSLYVLIGNEIWWAAGIVSATRVDDTISYDLSTATITTHALFPDNRTAMQGGACRARAPGSIEDSGGWWIYSFGGFNGAVVSGTFKYDTVTDAWLVGSSSLISRRNGGTVFVENPHTSERFFVITGGFDGAASELTTEMFSPDDGTYETLSVIGVDRDNKPGMVHHNGRIYVIGGDDGTASAPRDDMESNDRLLWALRPQLENFSNTEHAGPGARRIPVRRDTVAFKANQVYGFGTWDIENTAEIIKIGEE